MAGDRLPALGADDVRRELMTALIEITDLNVIHRARAQRRRGRLHAVSGVTLELGRGETLGIVGETGAGKTTLARAMLRHIEAESGEIHFDDRSLRKMRGKAFADFRRRAQLIFQDPVASLNPRLSIGDTLAEPLRVHRLARSNDVAHRVAELMILAGLPAELKQHRPAALTMGECRRVGIARALALGPELLLADEPISGLDLPIQTQIVNLLGEVRQMLGLSLILFARDFAAVRHLCSRIAVLYLGRIVEIGPTEEILRRPRHPYTQALVAAMPNMAPDAAFPAPTLVGEPASILGLPPGCAFHPRCAKAKTICRTGPTPSRRADGPVSVWCHLYPEPAVRQLQDRV
jgi:peptide/nickel transport system ATP-binding protein